MTPDKLDISRRRLFQLMGLGAAGVAGISACSPADDGEGEGGDSPEPQDVGGEFHGAYPFILPPEGIFNAGGLPFSPNPTYVLSGPYNDLVYIPAAYYEWVAKKWVNLLAEDFSLDTEALTFTLKIKPDLTWSNGDPVTADDYLTTMWCQWLRRTAAWGSIESMSKDDDQTVVINLKNPSAVIERYLLRASLVSTAAYGEWATQAQDLFESNPDQESKEFTKLSEDFTTWQPEELIASGPFNHDKSLITSSQLTMVRNDKGYAADIVRFEKVVIFNGETPDVAPLVAAGEVDYATHGFTPAQEQSFVSAGYDILRPPNYSGPAILFNLDRLPEFQDKRARQAIAHAIDRKANGTIAMGESGVGIEFETGFSDNQVPEWISDDDQGKLNRYEFDRAQATTLLQDAGWELRGKAWHKPNGDRAAYTLQYQSDFADYSGAGDDAVAQLNEFGLKVTAKGVVHTDHDIQVDQGKFDLAIHTWGSSAHPHPHFSFVQDLFIHNIPIAANQGGRGMAFELKNVETESAGAVNLQDLVNEAGAGLDEDEQREHVTTLALAFNELLPMVPIWERYGNNPVLRDERVTGFPTEDDDIVQQPAYGDNFVILGIYNGDIRPVEEG